MWKTFSEKNLAVPSKRELWLGLPCWIMFELGIPLLLLPLFDLSRDFQYAQYQITVFCLSFLMTAACFWRFLKQSMQNIRFGELLRRVVEGYALYWALSYIVSLLIVLIESHAPTEQINVNQETVTSLLDILPLPMGLCVCLLAPVTEECLVRGVVFAPLCRKRPWLAYLLSTLLFAGIHVAASIGEVTLLNAAEDFLSYVPACIVLGWMYQRTQTIAGPVALHCVINFAAVAVLSVF